MERAVPVTRDVIPQIKHWGCKDIEQQEPLDSGSSDPVQGAERAGLGLVPLRCSLVSDLTCLPSHLCHAQGHSSSVLTGQPVRF